MKNLKQTINLAFLLMAIFTVTTAYTQKTFINTLDEKTVSIPILEKEIAKVMQENDIPGISIAIINNNQLAYHNIFGVSNAHTKEPLTAQSMFEAASLSKPIFAYFVMKMAEKGKIDLDTPLYKYLPHPGIAPESQEEYKLITARMVLAHQTGFPNHSNNEPIKLAFTPGTGFMYSGEAYQYLAAIIGMQNGVGWKADLNAIFQKEVTKPLNMEHTTFVWQEYLDKHKVFGHDANGNPTANQPRPGYWDGTTFNAYSSLHSRADEYAKFILAMLKKEGLRPESFNEMLKEQTHFKDDNPLKQQTGQTGWSLGFAQKKTPDYTMHMHTGNNHDFQAYAMFVPEREYGIVIFTNSDKMEVFLEGFSKFFGPQF